MHARTLITAAALATSACATPRAPAAAPDAMAPTDLAERVDRLRGCWIARNGTGATFLRLLPPTVGAPTIEGGIDRTDTSSVDRVARLSFARDGSAASVATGQGEPEAFVAALLDWAPSKSTWLTYRTKTEPTLFMLIEAPGETLRIMTTLGPVSNQPMALSPLYEANRDGCD